MDVSITGVGLATAQGSVADVVGGTPLTAVVPWPRLRGDVAPRRDHRPARSIDPALTGNARFATLARAALDDCFGGAAPPSSTPIFVATCNGAADEWDADGWRASFDVARALEGTPWAGRRPAVASAACASGLHALFLARRALAAGAPEAIVLAADIVSRPSHESFETLRLIAGDDEPPPWQPGRAGFLLGEAAVVLRLARGRAGDATALRGPVLGHDLDGDDGLVRVLAGLAPIEPSMVVAQGTGPSTADRAELDALRGTIDADVPLTSALHNFGHTLGASGLLSTALAALAARGEIPRALTMPVARASDGRPLVRNRVLSWSTVVACRALGGACAALTVGDAAASPRHAHAWRQPAPPPPLRDPMLRKLVYAAPRHRPATPPDVLLVRLEAPLVPPSDAAIGGRLLPSSILEMTPGFVAQLVTRSWGFPGAAICLVAPDDAEVQTIASACREAGDVVCRVDVRGQGGERDVDWQI